MKLQNALFIACLLALSLLLASCNSYKSLVYLQDLEQAQVPQPVHQTRILPNDLLSIVVYSEIQGAADDFNLPLVPTGSTHSLQTTGTAALSSGTSGTLQNYLVDAQGNIQFPVLGQVQVGGLSLQEAQDRLAQLISPQYIASTPIVTVRPLNFSVSVLGEVAHPGTVSSNNGNLSLLDALAAAGDLTLYGKRDNVLLVRTQADGSLHTHRINLQKTDWMHQPELFYLQQNDKLYVQTNKARGNSSRFGSLETLSLSALSVLISIIAIATR